MRWLFKLSAQLRLKFAPGAISAENGISALNELLQLQKCLTSYKKHESTRFSIVDQRHV